MPTTLNAFKTTSANVTIAGSTVYTVPSGYTSVALLAQVSNLTQHTIGVSAYHVRSGTHTSIISNVQIPESDAVNLLTGKLIFQTGDSFLLRGSEDNTAQLLLSVLETAN